MNQWLAKGKVPLDHQIHHRVPLFKGGANLPGIIKRFLMTSKKQKALERSGAFCFQCP